MSRQIRISIAIAFLLSSCASYTPNPLPNTAIPATTLASEALLIPATSVSRPWLRPIQINLDAPLHPDAIAALAVINNPDLASLRARAGIADAQVFAAGLLPDPTFSVAADKVLRGPDTLLNLAASLLIDINVLRTRTLTRTQATAQARSVHLDVAWAEWQTAGQARLLAARIQSFEQQRPIAQATAHAALQQAKHAAEASARGDIPAIDSQALRIAAQDASARLRTLAQDLLIARQSLNRLLGLPPDAVLALANYPLHMTVPAPVQDLFAEALAQRSDLAALRAGYSSQEATLHKAVLQQFPTINLTITGNRDSAGNLLLGPTVDFTLPLWNRNRGVIAIEQSTRDALKAEYQSRLFQTHADLAAARDGLLLAQHQYQAALEDAEALHLQANRALAGAARGDVAPASAYALSQQWRDRQMLLAQLQQAITEQTIALTLLCGAPSRVQP